MKKTVVFSKSQIVKYTNFKELDRHWLKHDKIKLTGEDLFKIALIFSNRGERVNIKITDQLRSDFNVYKDNYNFYNFIAEFGEELSSEIDKITIIKEGKCSVNLTKSSTAYVSIFSNEDKTDDFLSEIKEVIVSITNKQ